MAWHFRKSFKLLPGIRLNLGKKGISSLSVGPRGAKLNISDKGTRLTTSIPGTGISHTTQLTKRLDKPVGNTMTECPFCGHRMRKQWNACPTCKNSLIQTTEAPRTDETTIIDAKSHFIDDKKMIAPPHNKHHNRQHSSHLNNNQKKDNILVPVRMVKALTDILILKKVL